MCRPCAVKIFVKKSESGALRKRLGNTALRVVGSMGRIVKV